MGFGEGASGQEDVILIIRRGCRDEGLDGRETDTGVRAGDEDDSGRHSFFVRSVGSHLLRFRSGNNDVDFTTSTLLASPTLTTLILLFFILHICCHLTLVLISGVQTPERGFQNPGQVGNIF